jgi:hypothetical protein
MARRYELLVVDELYVFDGLPIKRQMHSVDGSQRSSDGDEVDVG